MNSALFDTNIVIDLLNGDRRAQHEVASVGRPSISVISWMEVMVGATVATDALIRAALAGFDSIRIDDDIMERAVELRRENRIKLDDAIIWASAQTRGLTLVTRNTKDFPADTPGVRVPYAI